MMALFIVMGVAGVMALAVIGFLFYLLNKEGERQEDAKAVPLKDLEVFKPDPPSFAYQELVVPPEEFVQLREVKPIDEEDTYKKRVQELEEQLQVISTQANNQSQEAMYLAEALSKENTLLKEDQLKFKEAQEKLSQLELQANELHADNTALQSTLDQVNEKVRFLEDEIVAVKKQMGQEIIEANAMVAKLKIENEKPLLADNDIVEGLRQELGALTQQLDGVKQVNEDLQRSNEKLRDLNTHLMEKSGLLQYELTKARAQAVGMERVGQNYKIQTEELFKKIEGVESTNVQLAEVKNRLEMTMAEVASENEDLVRQGRLARQELDQQRTHLVTLEREFEDFKLRLRQENSNGQS